MVQWIQPRSLGQKQQRYDDQNLFLSHDVLLHNTLNSLKQQNTLLLDPPVKFYFPRALIYQKRYFDISHHNLRYNNSHQIK